MTTTTVARYNFQEKAADAAVLRTAESGIAHHVEHDVATDTWVVTADRTPQTSRRSLIRATFEVHSDVTDWALYHRVANVLVYVGSYADKRNAIKAGEAL